MAASSAELEGLIDTVRRDLAALDRAAAVPFPGLDALERLTASRLTAAARRMAPGGAPSRVAVTVTVHGCGLSAPSFSHSFLHTETIAGVFEEAADFWGIATENYLCLTDSGSLLSGAQTLAELCPHRYSSVGVGGGSAPSTRGASSRDLRLELFKRRAERAIGLGRKGRGLFVPPAARAARGVAEASAAPGDHAVPAKLVERSKAARARAVRAENKDLATTLLRDLLFALALVVVLLMLVVGSPHTKMNQMTETVRSNLAETSFTTVVAQIKDEDGTIKTVSQLTKIGTMQALANVYAWMRHPLRTFLFPNDRNHTCGNSSAAACKASAEDAHWMGVGNLEIVSALQFRQLRVRLNTKCTPVGDHACRAFWSTEAQSDLSFGLLARSEAPDSMNPTNLAFNDTVYRSAFADLSPFQGFWWTPPVGALGTPGNYS